jgi:TolB protein
LAALFKIDGGVVEEPLATLPLAPVALPPGFLGSSTNEGEHAGSARFDPGTGEITLQGSGWDIWDAADGFYFVSRPVDGDFQITVTALTRPTRTHEAAEAGLMIREGLEAGSRHAMLVTQAAHGLSLQWRPIKGEGTEFTEAIAAETLQLPLMLRLTRRGNTITAHYSLDEGRSFQAAGDPILFAPPLAKGVHAGLAITAHDESQVSEAKFRDLKIEPPGAGHEARRRD